jgi:hypothetical protein
VGIAPDDEARSMSARRTTVMCCAFAAMCSVAVQAAVIRTWIRHYVTEDQALLWAAARSWGHLQPRQPNFWGQAYGTTAEATPAEVLRWLGMPLSVGLPVAVALFNSLGWFALGYAAIRRSQPVAAVMAYGAIAILSPAYAVLTVGYNTAAARGCGGLCAAVLATASPLQRRRVWGALALGALGVAFDTSLTLLMVPVGLYAFSRLRPDAESIRTWARFVVSAAVPALVWFTFTRWWYRAYPADSLHPEPSLRPSLHELRHNMSTIGEFLGTYSPTVLRSWLVPVLAVAALATLARRRGSHVTLISVALVVLVTVFALAVKRAGQWMATSYYPAARLLLPLPMALFFIWAVCSSDALNVRSAWPVVCAAGFVAVSIGWFGLRWNHDVTVRRDLAVGFENYPATPVDDLERLCERVDVVARETGARFVVFDRRTPAYGCAGLGLRASTVYPQYERRSWMLRQFLASRDASVLVVRADAVGCVTLAGTACQTMADSTATAEIDAYRLDPAVSRREFLVALGLPIRPPF